jgi:hypothetical protein
MSCSGASRGVCKLGVGWVDTAVLACHMTTTEQVTDFFGPTRELQLHCAFMSPWSGHLIVQQMMVGGLNRHSETYNLLV